VLKVNLKLLSFVTVQRARALLTKGKHGESFTLKNILNVLCVLAVSVKQRYRSVWGFCND
jgi:hypothetical protein